MTAELPEIAVAIAAVVSLLKCFIVGKYDQSKLVCFHPKSIDIRRWDMVLVVANGSQHPMSNSDRVVVLKNYLCLGDK